MLEKEIDENGKKKMDPNKISNANVESLSKQCGISYRASENSMFSTGNQPFVVKVRIDG